MHRPYTEREKHPRFPEPAEVVIDRFERAPGIVESLTSLHGLRCRFDNPCAGEYLVAESILVEKRGSRFTGGGR